MAGMPRLVLVVVLLLTAAPARADGQANRVALELSPMSVDWFYGGEYVAHELVSSTVVAVAYERRLAPHVAAGAVVSYVQPGSQILPFVPALDIDPGNFSNSQLRASGRMVAPQARLRLVFPFAGDAGEVGLGAQAGPAFLWFPGGYQGSGVAANAGVDVVWFWSQWGAALRASVGLAVTTGTNTSIGTEQNAGIDRYSLAALTVALLRRF
jgi:hypothetical protein